MKRLGPLLPVLAILVTLLFYAIPAAANPSAPIDGPQQSTTGPTPPLSVLQRDQQKPADRAQDIASEVLLTVPAYLWRHGCGPTALGMVVGYYDSQGFNDLVPGSASNQTAAVSQVIASGGDDGSPYPPGSEQHFEDYASPVDDYTTGMLTDDALAKGRTPHTSNSLADFMQTSFSERDNMYGWSWSNDVGPAWTGYVQFANPAYTPSYLEYRWIYGEMTWEVLTAEIDAGRPMVFLVDTDANGGTDHFVAVIGYRTSPSQQYAAWDTWSDTSVRWENFAGMAAGVPWGIWGGWSFQLLGAVPPGEFARLSPVDQVDNQPVSLSLDWQNSPGASSYEYCLDTLDDDACTGGWVDAGNVSGASPGDLSFNTTYFWQVRALNSNGMTYANTGEADYWSFSTQSAIRQLGVWTADGEWNKKTSFKPGETIQWVIEVENLAASALAINLTFDVRDPHGTQVVHWQGSESAEPGITYFGLSSTAPGDVLGAYAFTGSVEYLGETTQASTTYYVSQANPPGAFYKVSPADGITVLDTSVTLDWTDSLNATTYEYCYDTTDNDACTSWISVGASSSVELSSLAPGNTYYWQVRALNEGGVRFANDLETAYWSFSPKVQEWLFLPWVTR